jgi:hypothetical protein
MKILYFDWMISFLARRQTEWRTTQFCLWNPNVIYITLDRVLSLLSNLRQNELNKAI